MTYFTCKISHYNIEQEENTCNAIQESKARVYSTFSMLLLVAMSCGNPLKFISAGMYLANINLSLHGHFS